MRKVMLSVAVAATMAAIGAGAAHAADDGQYGLALRRIVTEAAAGTCAADLMAEPLLSACRDQMPQMKPALAALGTVEGVSFIKAEAHDDARVETYAVKYSGGKTSLWSLGNRKDGKFTVAYTLGE
jgi:hypothetical protein